MSGVNTSQFRPEGHQTPEKNDGSYERETSIAFDFVGHYSDRDKAVFRSIQYLDLRKICFFLNTDMSTVSGMRYNIFDSDNGKRTADPQHSISRASARFNEFAIYRHWNPPEDMHFPHEITHLVAHRWSQPYVFETDLDTANGGKLHRSLEMVSTSFMQEGLAIAVDDMLFNRPLQEHSQIKYIDAFCREADKMPTSLRDVINIDGFRSLPNEVVVPFAASFAKFLIREYGLKPFKEAYIGVKETLSPNENVEIIESVFQEKEGTLLADWKRSLIMRK